MKKAFIICLFLCFGLTFSDQRVYAAENTAIEQVTKDDIPKLVIDPSREVAVYKLIPKPTPEPVFPSQDNRSWAKSPYKDPILKTAEKYNLDPQLIYATIMTESEGDELAFRYEPHIKDASFCLGQILISTARLLGFTGTPKELYKPEICIDLMGKYHRNMLDTYGELTPVQLATAYNSGSPYKRPVRGHILRFQKWLNEAS